MPAPASLVGNQRSLLGAPQTQQQPTKLTVIVSSTRLPGVPIDHNPLPANRQLPNTTTVAANSAAVRAQLDYYLQMGAIHITDRRSLLAVHPFHVVLRELKKPRLVGDFSLNLNDLLTVPAMRYSSSIDAAVAASHPGCWYSKLDIKDCFLSFSVRDGDDRYLGFEFEGKYYRFSRMPFGLNTAPEMCELLLSVVSWQLTRQGITHVRYCDDILIIAPTKLDCDHLTRSALLVLDSFGFAIAHTKTIYSVQVIEFLGVLFDSLTTTVACPPARILELTRLLETATKHGSRHATRFILSLVGKLSFAAHVLPSARPFFRSLIDLTRSAHRHGTISLDSAARHDLSYWLAQLSTWNGRQLWRSADPITIATDASLHGWGGLLISAPSSLSLSLPASLAVGAGTAGRWCTLHHHLIAESKDIGWGELFAVHFMVATLGPLVPNSTLVFLVDNQGDAAIINRQSTRSHSLLPLLRAIYSVATEHNLSIVARHIPGTTNTYADALSRSLPLPSHLPPLGSVCYRCSCEVPKTTVTCWPSSSMSLLTSRCGVQAKARMPVSSVSTSDSVPTLVSTPVLRLMNSVSVKPPYTSVPSDRLPVYPTSAPLYNGGTTVSSLARYQRVLSTRRLPKVSRTYTVSSIAANPHTPLLSHNSTSSLPTATLVRLSTPETGVQQSLDSLDYSALASTQQKVVIPFSSGAAPLPSPRQVFTWSSRSPKPAFVQSMFASAPVLTSSVLAPLPSTTYPSSRTAAQTATQPIPSSSNPSAPLFPSLLSPSYLGSKPRLPRSVYLQSKSQAIHSDAVALPLSSSLVSAIR